MHPDILIDGSSGGGGGQPLRTSLALALLTGRGFTLRNFRADRENPGLLRSHLSAVRAAAAFADARVEGDRIGSRELSFAPGSRQGDRAVRCVADAGGSAPLLARMMLPALLDGASERVLVVEGATLHPRAPSFEWFRDTLAPCLGKLGIELETWCERPGFHPMGGGIVGLKISPWRKRKPADFRNRGERREAAATVFGFGIPDRAIEKERLFIATSMGWPEASVTVRRPDRLLSAGLAASLSLGFASHVQRFDACGLFGPTDQPVSGAACSAARTYLEGECFADEHLADALLPFLAMAGGGRLSSPEATPRLRATAAITEAFLPVVFETKRRKGGGVEWKVRRP